MSDGSKPAPINVFCFYASADEGLYQELRIHMASLVRRGYITLSTNQGWQKGINEKEQLDKAALILLLISPHFMADESFWSHMPSYLMERERLERARVVPVLVKPADIDDPLLTSLTPLPGNRKFINQWANRDEAWFDVVESLRRIINNLPTGRSPQLYQNEPPTPRSAIAVLEEKRQRQEFDVFFCYNSSDKSEIVKIAELLRQYGILPWLDIWELIPGRSWQSTLEKQIGQIKTAAVFVGESGIGPWQTTEMIGILSEFAQRRSPVIPVLLPSASKDPELPLFLQSFSWVDFRLKQPDQLQRLIWGITGKKSQETYIGVNDILDNADPKNFSLALQEAQIREDLREIGLAINNPVYRSYERLSPSIIRLLGAKDPKPVEFSQAEPGTVWEISLPSIGLRLDTGNALFFLRRKGADRTFYESLIDIKNDKKADLLIVIDMLEIGKSLPPIDFRIVWFQPADIEELFKISREDVLAWLGRFVTSQVANFDQMLPYVTRGPANLEMFVGRNYELQRLMSSQVRGGIIMGAHWSGKTSLLVRLGERLKKQGFVVGSYTVGADMQMFYEYTLKELKIAIPSPLTLASWSSALRNQQQQQKQLVLLLDEVDPLLRKDAETGYNLGREMRALQYDGYCKFYLAGHAGVREAIELEGGPLRNFAEEITLRGLDKYAALKLIQEPIRAIGFRVTDQQAERIFIGTAGVAMLIQAFCIHLLRQVRHDRNSEIKDDAITKVERHPDYLKEVLAYYYYGQTWASKAVMVMVSSLGDVSQQDIIEKFSEYGAKLTWDNLSEILGFLVRFGVLEEFEAGSYRVLSTYLRKAIEAQARKTDKFFISLLEMRSIKDDGL